MKLLVGRSWLTNCRTHFIALCKSFIGLLTAVLYWLTMLSFDQFLSFIMLGIAGINLLYFL